MRSLARNTDAGKEKTGTNGNLKASRRRSNGSTNSHGFRPRDGGGRSVVPRLFLLDFDSDSACHPDFQRTAVMNTIKKFANLNTSYVNLAGLLRQLREEQFIGTVHLVLDQYEAEVHLSAASEPTVLEINRSNGRSSESHGAMERLLVHAREPGGKITVYEPTPLGTAEADDRSMAVKPRSAPGSPPAFATAFPAPAEAATEEPASEVDWADLLEAGGKLIGAVERAVTHMGADFTAAFRAARLELGDDYPFLDPTLDGMDYRDKMITLKAQPAPRTFVTALAECLRRVINKLAIGNDGKRFRETVAIELAVAARMRANGLSQFTEKLSLIAGTQVL